MTPREKALELVRETFCFFLGDNGSEEFWTEELECKRAAIECVNEILVSLWNVGHSYSNDEIKFYTEVKQEINKL